MKNYFAFDIGGTSIKYAMITSDYQILVSGSCRTPYEGADAMICVLTELVQPYLAQICGIGISAPGTMTGDEDGTVYRGGSLQYMHEVPLGRLMREATGLPCTVENDGKCCALGEYASGALQKSHIGVVMALGTGIGGGIVLDGQLLRGAHDFAGEFSFLISEPTQLPRGRALSGFLNGSPGLKAAVLKHKQLPEDTDLDGHAIFELANRGDEAVLAGITEFCRYLAILIYNVQAILDPDVIAIGGGISRQPLLLRLLHEQLQELYTSIFFKPPQANVVCCTHGNEANLHGAVYDFRQKLKHGK